MLSIGSYPDLPGLHLVDPRPDQFDGQIVYLDFDGENDITYNGPIVVEDIDIPVFEAPGKLAGQTQEIIAELVIQLEETFASTGILFTTERPVEGIEYSTIYVGGDDSAFEEYGALLGLAEEVDVGNHSPVDIAFVFANSGEYTGKFQEAAGALAAVAAHELGHLLGMAHEGESLESPIASVAYGLTILTHGNLSSAGEEWVVNTSNDLVQRIGGSEEGDVVQATLTVSEGANDAAEIRPGGELPAGTLSDLASSRLGEMVLLIDWSELCGSNDQFPNSVSTSTTDVGNAIADYLFEKFATALEMPIHMIGHSRGASLNVVIAKRLA